MPNKKIKKCDWCGLIRILVCVCPECGNKFCKECKEQHIDQCPSAYHEPPELEEIK